MQPTGRDIVADVVSLERFPAPAFLAEHARRFQESGATPVTPRVAATVVLLRPTSDGAFEAFTIRRAATMAFAPNMYAFPGGSVDPRDQEAVIPDATAWARRFGLAEPDARAVVCAAVREVFEECGVVLAGPDQSTVVSNVTGPEWERARGALLSGELSLVDVLAARGLTVRSDLLVPWARWLTPEFEPRRFDTYFFLARLPDGQAAQALGGEAAHTAWVRPQAVDDLAMLPPTRDTLASLTAFASIEAAFADVSNRSVTTPIRPVLEVDDDGVWLTIPR
jgi:8-oxo-dGTP pyrophosphatase MutT (NUDIX family)